MKSLTIGFRRFLPSFPLLGKELVEQASRRRTYALRAAMIIFIMIIMAVMMENNKAFSGPNMSIRDLSYLGEQIFVVIMICQLFAAVILLPGMMSTVITSEKERSSLELLFLTQMKPRDIILQKYLSRIIPMLMFFFLGLPLIAVAYSFGGLSGRDVYELPVFVIISMLQIGAFSLMLSAFFATTAEAVVCSYLAVILDGFFFYYFIVFCEETGFLNEDKAIYLFMAFQLVSTVLFLFLGVKFLKGRSEVRRRHYFRKLLDFLDRLWFDMNRLYGGFQVIKEERDPLPNDSPIAWYEKIKSPVGRISYKVRLALIAYVPVLLCLMLKLPVMDRHESAIWFQTILVIYLLVTAIFLCVSGATVISSERTNQTLDVLLTTPVRSEDIVREKMKRGRAYVTVFCMPIIILSLLVNDKYYFDTEYLKEGIILLIVIFFVFFPLISWVSCLCGLLIKSQVRAIFTAFMLMLAWLASPLLLMLLERYSYRDDSFLFFIAYGSPGFSIYEAFFENTRYFEPIAFYICSGGMFMLYLFLRSVCIRNADKYIRRR